MPDSTLKSTFRPIDLARLAGVSAQQIRNYVAEGVLPPTGRTASGYRVFGERHRAALLTFRALGRGYGWPLARAVMRAAHEGDVPGALSLVDEAHAAVHEQRRTLAATEDALAAVAAEQPRLPRGDLQIGDAARVLGVRTSALRVWEDAGLLSPERERGTGYRRYTPADVRDARMITMLRANRYSLDQILPILEGLRESGSTAALKEAVEVRRAALVTRSRLMLAGAAELHRYLP